jgi:glucose-6-phosphate 1-dehydrogenase
VIDLNFGPRPRSNPGIVCSEPIDGLMAFRFANGLFEPIWNRDRIDYVQITAAETVGVEGRGSFYEATGALRDMVPNHLFTLLSMVAMGWA